MAAGREVETGEGLRVAAAGPLAAGRVLGDRLLSAYAIGSLGHGGFSAAVSDVDLALFTSDLVGGAALDEIRDDVRREVRRPLAERLSIFHVPWADFGSPPAAARFPPIDRLDLMRHGVLLAGEDLRERFGTEPSAEEVLGHSVSAALVRHTPESLPKEIATLTPQTIDGRAASKLVLWPVRLLHTVDTLEAAGNDDAVSHYRDGGPRPRQLALVEAALSWRNTGEVPDPEDAIVALRSEVIPLYGEIYGRLAGRRDLPRAEEVAERAEAFEAASA